MARIPVACPMCKSTEWVCIHESERSTLPRNNFDRMSFGPGMTPPGISVKRQALYSCRKCGFSRNYDL